MVRLRPLVLLSAAFLFVGTSALHAGDVRITIPKRSKPTPVQKLNRDGVKAVEHHEYDKAKKLFYKAYLLDPNDPFTLNNLGYMAEIDGEIDRAQRFYELAAEQNSDAVVDEGSSDLVVGKRVSQVAGVAENKGVQINRYNVQAISLLSKDRAPEADLVLQKALKLDSHNPFTLNNLGYTKEKEGELEAAVQYYTAAAGTRSREPIEVALKKDWRGRPISEVAADNAKKARRELQKDSSLEARVARLNLRGVSAMNRNDHQLARDLFQQAYKLDPRDAFTLNNMGYLAEMDGDRETADFYYARAREANRSGAHVTLATRKDVEGKKIGEVASSSDRAVISAIDTQRQERERQGGPVLLHKRDGSTIVEPEQPPPQLQPRATANTSQPSGGLMEPLPDNQQPPNAGGTAGAATSQPRQGPDDGGLLMPLPDNQQPGAQPNGSGQQANPPQPKQGPNDGGLLMPLPDDQQPGGAAKQPLQTQPQASQPQSKQGQNDGGLLMPLPDDQQPKVPDNQNSSNPK